MMQKPCFTMCATTFAPGGAFDDAAMRGYLARQVEAGVGVYVGSGGNGETHAMTAEELHRLYVTAVAVCRGRVPVHANLPEAHTAEATIAQARIAISAGVEALHFYTVEGRHGYRPTDRELVGYYDDVFAEIDFPAIVAVNPTMGYIPKPEVMAEICRRHKQVIGVRLSGQRALYLVTLQAMLPPLHGHGLQWHWQLGSGAFDPLALGAVAFSAEANIIPRTFRQLVDQFTSGAMQDAAVTLSHLVRFNEVIMRYGPCARWVKMCMTILRLPGWEGGLRKPYLMPPADELARFARDLRALRVPEFEEMAARAGDA